MLRNRKNERSTKEDMLRALSTARKPNQRAGWIYGKTLHFLNPPDRTARNVKRGMLRAPSTARKPNQRAGWIYGKTLHFLNPPDRTARNVKNMRKTIAIFVIVTLTCLLTWRFVQSDSHEQPMEAMDESEIILAEYKWNGEPHQISLADLNAAIAELPVYRQQNYETREDKAEYLEELIDERLQILRAADDGFDSLEEHVKKLEDYTHQLMVEKLTEAEVDAKIVISDEDLMAKYQANLSDYIEEAKVRATCITIDDEDFGNETLDAIKAGKDIIEMAKELGEAGKLANGPGTNQDDPGNTYMFTKSASPRWAEFIDAVFEQEIGEMTDTLFEVDVNDETFYLIFRKEEHHPDRQQEFDEVKDDVRRTVEREKKRARINEWVSEITEKGKLKTYPENIPEPPKPEEAETEESDQ